MQTKADIEIIKNRELVIFHKVKERLLKKGIVLSDGKIQKDFENYLEALERSWQAQGEKFSLQDFFRENDSSPNRWIIFRVHSLEPAFQQQLIEKAKKKGVAKNGSEKSSGSEEESFPCRTSSGKNISV